MSQSALDTLASVWSGAGLPPDQLSNVILSGDDPVLPSSFAVARAAQASIGAAGLAAAMLWHLRSGQSQAVRVDARDAAIEFRSDRYLEVDGRPRGEDWDPISGLHRARDGWVRLHANFPHHRDGLLRLLGTPHDRDAVSAALVLDWDAIPFETAATEAGLAVAALRDRATWLASAPGMAVDAEPLVAIERIGDAPPEPLPDAGDRPLAGVRVLDLTRVIAGPVCGRTLAGHGADVLLITAAHLPSMPGLVIDTGRGKLSASLDLRDERGRGRLAELLRDADVFVQGYRPGAIAGHGFGPEKAARLRPGIIYVSLSAYGYTGPWSGKRGFDSLAQTATGFNAAEAEANGEARPRALPAQALDHASGFLLAFGAMAALYRRATEGGSWHVRVSLARTGHWLFDLPRITGGLAAADPTHADVQDRLEAIDSGFGPLRAVRHAAVLTETPYRHVRPSVPLGTHAAEWPAGP